MLVIVSCKEDLSDGIPAYIRIDNITVIDTTDNRSITDTNSYRNIIDAWVRINGIKKGVYELPANFPVLNNGDVEVKIFAGIKGNGINTQRISYPFYYSNTINTTLMPDSVTIINPIVSVKENISGQFDDFENSVSFSYDSCCFQRLTNGPYGYYGSLTLSDSDSISITEISYKDYPLRFDNVPQNGSPTYMELDYKCNTSFVVGVYINFPNSLPLEKGLLWVNPKEDWNKIYIDLTQTVSEAIGAETFSVFIKMQRDSNLDESKLDFDNIRIIHYKK
jgi:hypothetical protein